jgi:hypothetical protein
MRYEPSFKEFHEITHATEEVRLQYFLTRTIESEEVWGIGDNKNWLLKEIGDQLLLPVWPYERFAEAWVVSSNEDNIRDAVSLEQFVYHILPTMIQQDISVEVLPTENKPGKIITARELSSLFEGLMESGEYFLEG